MPPRRRTRGASRRRNDPLSVAPVLRSTTRQRISYAPAPEVLDSSTRPPQQKRQRRNPSSDRSTDHQSTSEDPGRPLTDHDVPSIVKAVLDALPGTGTDSSHGDSRYIPSPQADVPRKLLNRMLAIL